MARLQAARVALEQTASNVDAIALETGFGNAERMRRSFQRHLGVSATEYRERFSLPSMQGSGEDPP